MLFRSQLRIHACQRRKVQYRAPPSLLPDLGAYNQRDEGLAGHHKAIGASRNLAENDIDEAIIAEERIHDPVDDDPGEEMRYVHKGLAELFERGVPQIEYDDCQENGREKGEQQSGDADGQGVAHQLQHLGISEYILVVIKSHPWRTGNRASYLHVFEGYHESPDDREIAENEIICYPYRYKWKQYAILFETETQRALPIR